MYLGMVLGYSVDFVKIHNLNRQEDGMKNERKAAWSSLPVSALWEEITKVVTESPVTILTAETGAGKSTLVPIMLAMMGCRVICTQPRRLAARSVAQRVAQMLGTRLGDLVGYRTADEGATSAATEITFVTDGLQLVRELAGRGGTGQKTVLVLDEVHEWNVNMETLVAWVKARLAAGDDLRVVLMSATLDAERLSSFFSGAPVMQIPGRMFPVEKRQSPAKSLVDEAAKLAEAGRNVLVFQPGKKEIAETVSALQFRLGAKALVLPLHGELDSEEQQRCFAAPPTGKVKVVVATNVAQTSVTIPDIDGVVDSGVERRVELRDGIEGLYLMPISKADCLQRAGRAGRTKAGEYVLCADKGLEDRPPFPTAEILRSRLDQLTLRLAVQGFDAAKLEFFHQPERKTLETAKVVLEMLGAIDAAGTVTKVGRKMARFPVAVQYARMLVEAESRGVVSEVVTIAACLEAGDIRAKGNAWRGFTKEASSDLVAMLDVFSAGRGMKGRPGEGKADALRNAGLFAKSFFEADRLRERMLEVLTDHFVEEIKREKRGLQNGELRRAAERRLRERSGGPRDQVVKACVAGFVDHLYRHVGGGEYKNADKSPDPRARELVRESVLDENPEWVVGLPKDIEIVNKKGRKVTLCLLSMATAVDPMVLAEVAPQLVENKLGLSPRYSPEKDVCVSTTQIYFNGQMVKEEQVEDPEHPDAPRVLAEWLTAQIYGW